MSSPPAWTFKALRILGPVVLVLLVVQYLLGLWTADYAPSTFTNNTSYPSLDWHYNIGFTLGLLSLVIVVIAALTRSVRIIGPAIGLVIGVLVAGALGGRFVNTAPNDPLASFGMGLFFLVAFGSAMGVNAQVMRARNGAGKDSPATPGAPSPG